MTEELLDILEIGDLITTRIGDWMIVRKLEFEDHRNEPITPSDWYVPVDAGRYKAHVNISIDSIWRIERDGVIIWQSDLPAIDPQYAGLPLFAGLEEHHEIR